MKEMKRKRSVRQGRTDVPVTGRRRRTRKRTVTKEVPSVFLSAPPASRKGSRKSLRIQKERERILFDEKKRVPERGREGPALQDGEIGPGRKGPEKGLFKRFGRDVDRSLIRLNINLAALFFLSIFAISLFSLAGSLSGGAGVSMPAILLFILQAIIGYALIINIVLPRERRKKVKTELLDYKIFFVTFILVLFIVGVGWLFRESTFILIVSFPAFCISILCLMGGIGVALKRSLFSYTVFFSGLGLLIIDAIRDVQDHSLFHSMIFALSGFIYLELTGAGERLAEIGSRIDKKYSESDRRTLNNYKVAFVKKFTKYCSISAVIFVLIMLFPLLFKAITAIFALEGYPLMLSESVEIDTLYIYLLPASVAVMVLVIIKFIRFTNIYFSVEDEPDTLINDEMMAIRQYR